MTLKKKCMSFTKILNNAKEISRTIQFAKKLYAVVVKVESLQRNARDNSKRCHAKEREKKKIWDGRLNTWDNKRR